MLLQEPIEWGHVGFGVQARARPGRPGAVHFRRQPGIRWVHPSCTQPGLEYTSGHPSITHTDHLCHTVREPTHMRDWNFFSGCQGHARRRRFCSRRTVRRLSLIPCAPRAQSISPRRKLPVRNTLGTFAPFFDRMLSVARARSLSVACCESLTAGTFTRRRRPSDSSAF